MASASNYCVARPLDALRIMMEFTGRSCPWPTPKKSPTGASTLAVVLPS